MQPSATQSARQPSPEVRAFRLRALPRLPGAPGLDHAGLHPSERLRRDERPRRPSPGRCGPQASVMAPNSGAADVWITAPEKEISPGHGRVSLGYPRVRLAEYCFILGVTGRDLSTDGRPRSTDGSLSHHRQGTANLESPCHRPIRCLILPPFISLPVRRLADAGRWPRSWRPIPAPPTCGSRTQQKRKVLVTGV